ncbi:hypothetical protein BH09ACT1_BH09ACT1_24320 [soil metagenome]
MVAMVRLPNSPADLERGRRLGALLRDARGSRSMLDVALSAGLSPETLRKIETGRVATPAFSTIASVSAVLDLSLDIVWLEISRSTDDETSASSEPGPRGRLAS